MSRVRRLCLAAGIAAFASVSFASAPATADYVAHIDSFDGAGSTPNGAFVKPTSVAVNNQTGDVLVLDEGQANPVMQFDADGDPKPFSALGGSNSLGPLAIGGIPFWGLSTDITVDNSGTSTQGTIYVVSAEPPGVYAYHPDGTPVGGKWPIKDIVQSCGVALDKDGDVWIFNGNVGVEYDAAGDPTGTPPRDSGGGCRSAFDGRDFLYSNFYTFGGVRVYNERNEVAYGLDTPESKDVTVDPTTDEVYAVVKGTYVLKSDLEGNAGPSFGTEDPARSFDGLVNSEGLALNPVNGNIYVSDFGASPPRVNIFRLVPPDPPVVTDQAVREVRSAGATINAKVMPGGGETTYRVEYGLDTTYGSSTDGSTVLSGGFKAILVKVPVTGLQPNTRYHYRVVATNSTTSTPGPDRTFNTYEIPPGADTCSNALARKQTGAAGLLDCRAYELVSALDTDGYDVESDQVPDAAPIASYPAASGPSKVAYTTHSGSIPGTGSPTGHIGDPYVATRGAEGWATSYVGIPANGTPTPEAFASPLAGADAKLNVFAFGGDGLCDACLPDGSKGIPLRQADGSLVQGMAGSLSPAGAVSDGYVAKRFSADGSHFLFGSTSQFETDGNSNGDVSIYDRNLVTGVTRVVSKTPAGANLPCLGGAGTCHSPGDQAGISALDISEDGSRVLVAQRVSTDGKGNHRWRLYMSVDGSSQTIDLAPGAAAGVLFIGMTTDGSQVFFSSEDPLTTDDHDASADIYRADVSESASTLTRISTGSGGSGDTDSCDPVSDFVHARWNSLGNTADCDAVAIAGGGGLGVGDGSLYFLSPELLDGPGHGTLDAPNLFVARPGEGPRFVATLESSLNPPADPEVRRTVADSFTVFQGATGFTVDPSNGDFYVLDAGTGEFGDGSAVLSKFDSSGNPVSFSASAPYISGNTLTKTPKEGFFFGGGGQVAVDRSGGPTDGYIYVTNNGGAAVFDSTGTYLDYLPTGGCGVAVDPLGNAYTTDYYTTRRYTPVDGVPDNDIVAELKNPGFQPCYAVADSSGALYLTNPGSFAKRFAASQFGSAAPVGKEFGTNSTSVAVDLATGDVYVNERTRISQYNAAGELIVSDIGAGELTDSRGIWFDDGTLYASDFASGKIFTFGPVEPLPDPIESSPIVVRAVEEPGIRRLGDFQVTPEGGNAVFTSNLSLTGAPNDRYREIYRNDPAAGDFLCISCTPTGAVSEGDSSLSSQGLSIVDDGRVFFTSAAPLVLRDGGGRKDVYEWKEGDIQLISTGISAFDATLLGASSDGTDVYFFSRDELISKGVSGLTMKIYDAREEGGRFVIPTPPPCAASDECHGAGSKPPAPQRISTLEGTGGQHRIQPAKACRKSFLRKRGRCVKKATRRKKAQRAKRNG